MQKESMNTDKMAMIDAACADLLTYGIWDAKAKCKNLAKKYILGKKVPPEDVIFWPMGLLAAALWSSKSTATIVMRQKIEVTLAEYFERWEKRRKPLFYLDDLLSGETFLAIYEEYAESKMPNNIINGQNADKYLGAVEKMAAYISSCPTDETGSFPYRAEQGNGHIYADSIGLACPFLYEYGRFCNKNEYMELALKQIANFLAYGIDAQTGLPYHGYDIVSGTKYGIIGWGRAVGWLMRGMAACMRTEYGRERLQEVCISLTDSVIKWQRKDGYFSWQLQATEGPADTSATGMICLALKEGIEMDLLQGEAYKNALEIGKRAIQKSAKNGRIYDCSGECEGFSQYPQRYGAYPWALAMALMLDN